MLNEDEQIFVNIDETFPIENVYLCGMKDNILKYLYLNVFFLRSLFHDHCLNLAETLKELSVLTLKQDESHKYWFYLISIIQALS